MTQPTLDSFFSGGGKSISWRDKPLGTTVGGTIRQVHPPVQQIDPADNKPKFRKDGSPQMVVRIDLATNERDPQDPEDDGSRGLYVQGWMVGAIGEAVRKSGHQGSPEVGGHITVTLTAREPNATNPALNPTNKFSATYTRPQAAATGQFFDQGQPQGYPQQPAQQYPPQQAQYPPQQPPGFQQGPPPAFYPPQQPVAPVPPQPQYAPPPQVAQQALPAQYPQQQAPPQAAPQVQRPQAISQQAWDSMDPATQASIAQTMNDTPNF